MSREVLVVKDEPSARYCPICKHGSEAFESYGVKNRPNAKCPQCGSKGRHRLVWLFLERRTNFFDRSPKRMLHVAPEKRFIERFSKMPQIDYLSADLDSPVAMIKLDLTNIQFEADSFDVIYCSHVLEHVPDDRRAMAELRRVLRPGGWALVVVPVFGEATYENFAITTPEERLRHFGQADHVRKYGRDIAVRLASAGFEVEEVRLQNELRRDDLERYALSGSPLYYCTKR